MSQVYIARQPIYTRTMHVYGYELLYRIADEDVAVIDDPGAATANLLINTLSTIGLENLVGARPAFVNFPRDFLVGDIDQLLPANRIVVEVLETVEIDAEVLAGLQRLREQGFVIALDDFIYRPEAEPLLALTAIVKLDIRAHSYRELTAQVEQLRRPQLKLLAEKIETQEEFDLCHRLGFNYFQGYFLSRPKVLQGRRVPSSKLTLIQLLAELQRPDMSVARLEELIGRDVGLSYKLLRYINSAFFNLPRPVESIQRAIVFLGTRVIQKWATLLTLSRMDDRPTDLMVTAVVRARMCELLAEARGYRTVDVCFTAGLLSVLEALLDVPMARILSSLSLAPELNLALLEHAGVPGEVLCATLDYEIGNWDALHCGELDGAAISKAYIEAVSWSQDVCRVLIGE